MVSSKQIKKGLNKYKESYLDSSIQSLTTTKQWMVNGLFLYFIDKLDNFIEFYSNNDIVKAFGIIDEEHNVDIESINKYFIETYPESGIEFRMPKLFDKFDILKGTIRFTKKDLKELIECITEPETSIIENDTTMNE